MINYLDDWRKKKPSTIGDCLGKFKIKDKPKRQEWQLKAFDIADKLKIDFKNNRKELPKWLSLFRNAYKNGRLGRLESCYSFLADYGKSLTDLDKIRLFFWKYGKKQV
jgi:hypothetical protein